MGPIRGFIAPFRGAAFVARHRLWGWLVAPVLLNAALVGVATALALRVLRDRLPATGGSAATVGLWALALVAGLLLFLAAQPLVGAPFVDLLTERVEGIVRSSHPQRGLLASLGQSLWHGLLKTCCYALALGAMWALAPTGVGGPLGAGLYALFLAFDGFDYPLARRGVPFGKKWRHLLVHPGQTLGYCLGASLLYLIPLALLVAPSFAAVGATLVYLDTAPDELPSAVAPPRTEGTASSA